MSGRTFTYTTGFDSFVKTLMPEMQAPVRRKAGGVGDGMLRDVEEFINRFCVTAANDDGDLTFDSAGTYTFDGDLVVNGTSTLNGTSAINGSSTFNGDATVAGDMTLSGSGVMQTGSSGERVVIANDAPGYTVPGVWMWPSDTPDRPGAIFSSESGSVYSTVIIPPFDIADTYARISLSSDNTGYIWGQWDMEIANGSAGTPSLRFETDTNTGMYRYGTDQIGFTAGGSVRLRVGTTAHISTEPFRNTDGSASAPAYSFSSDTNTGMYRYGTDEIGFSTGGTVRFHIQAANVYVPTAGGSYVANSPTTGSGNSADWNTVFGVYYLYRNTSTASGKRNVQTDLEGWLTPDMVDQVVPKMWTRDHAPDFPEIGPMAEDMDAISPFLGVHGTDKDGNQILTGIDRNSYLSLLVLAVKDLRQRIHLLEAQSNRPV
jgi:hypothetical protein